MPTKTCIARWLAGDRRIVIGYYVHHHGRGHLHRAVSIARELREDVTGLSTLPRPGLWTGDWIQLDPDDRATRLDDATANGRLHWAPFGDPGIRNRAAQLSAWFESAAPTAFVSDVSVEAALLARLHGVPVVTVALPGQRTDPAHDLGFGISTAIIAAWPPDASGMLADSAAADRVSAVGAISRFPVLDPPAPATKTVLVLSGAGGAMQQAFPLDAAREQAPDWTWEVLGLGNWADQPWTHIRNAGVIVTHAGQNALAEVAAARRPAIVIPQERPFDEQLTTARVLAAGPWPALVLDELPTSGLAELLDRAAALDGTAWATWNDGGGAARAARIIESVSRAG